MLALLFALAVTAAWAAPVPPRTSALPELPESVTSEWRRAGARLGWVRTDTSGTSEIEDAAAGKVKTGVLLCATGHGMCIAANKVQGVRAANCRDMLDAELCRRHNDANVMCLGADLIGEEQLDRIIRVWLTTAFDGGRHIRRREKVTDYEKAKACGS